MQKPQPYSPPTKPSKGLNFARSYAIEKVLLEADPNYTDEQIAELDIEEAHTNPENFVVGVSCLTAKDLIDYENIFGIDLKVQLQRLDFVTWYLSFKARVDIIKSNPKALPKEEVEKMEADWNVIKDKLTLNAETNSYDTELGSISANIDGVYTAILAFVLSRLGRFKTDGSREAVEYKEILEILPHDALSVVGSDGQNLFYEIMQKAGLFNKDEQKEEEVGEPEKKAPRSSRSSKNES